MKNEKAKCVPTGSAALATRLVNLLEQNLIKKSF